MDERDADAAALGLAADALLTAPDQPPRAAKGEWFTPLIAFGQVVASQLTSLPVFRSSTCFEPGRITAPTLSCTFEVAGSIARVPMSPQSADNAQRPEVKRPRVSPTSRMRWTGGHLD